MNINDEIKEYEKEIKEMKLSTGLNLCTKHCAIVIGVSPSTIETWRKQGIGPKYIQTGGRVMYPIKEIAKFQILSQIQTA